MCAQRRLRSTWASAKLIRVFSVRMKKAWVLSYPLSAQRRLRSDWADTQADLSLRWMHGPHCWFCHVAANIKYKWLPLTKCIEFLFSRLHQNPNRTRAITNRQLNKILAITPFTRMSLTSPFLEPLTRSTIAKLEICPCLLLYLDF